MNMKKLISTALTVIMLLTSIIAVIPVNAFATSSETETQTDENNLTNEDLQVYLDNFYLKSNYATAAEMLEADKNYVLEYVDSNKMPVKKTVNAIVESSTADGKYTIYINRYTGFVYYKNNLTGQILTSNPIDVETAGAGEREKLMSQIIVAYTEISNSSKNVDDFNSIKWASRYSQVSVSKINGGLRVNYVLGDKSERFLLPGQITAKDCHDHIIKPMLDRLNAVYADAMQSVTLPDGETPESVLQAAFEAKLTGNYTAEDKTNLYYKYLYASGLEGTYSDCVFDNTKLKAYIGALVQLSQDFGFDSFDKTTIKSIHDAIERLFLVLGKGYALKDLHSNSNYYENGDPIPGMADLIIKENPICETTPIYVFDTIVFETPIIADFKIYSALIAANCPDYTLEMMYADEKACGYEYVAAQQPVFECALEYTFNADGSLSVSLPANSIEYDEKVYILKSITPLQYFGCGDMSKAGYVFFPDGSGSIIDFADFYSNEQKVSVNVSSKVYGYDYCYSFIEGKHREQVTMPVYGMVSTMNANSDTAKNFGVTEVTNGFFTVIEEGDALASFRFESGGSRYKYISVAASYTPYPIDKYELSDTISVGAKSEWNTMVAETKYSGNYVSRIVMLTDKNVGDALYANGNYYPSSYTGMATYYRNLLKANGTIRALENIEKNIPLYVEALGAMTILDKFLTFPVEKSIPLTTFEDVETIYKQLSDAKNHVKKLYDEYKEIADNPDNNELLRIEYQQKAEKYKSLLDLIEQNKIQNITNINFKLTGFANGGMNFTYPTKLKWEKCCGGKSGFENLIAFSEEEGAKEGYNLGIFPDFDFLYINNTAAFDGISNKGNVSRMIDNRYASKQVYNSVLGEFESFFAMVISSDTLLEHFETFNEKYSEFGHAKLSVSTLGANLNSNLDEEHTIDREASKHNSIKLLEEMVYQNGYELMMDMGNIFAAKYATHILNIPTDFSGFRYSSYSVPFIGMTLHGYVNYAGAPLNYSGSPAYDILRAIETGANPYYIVSFQNSAFMKDDKTLSKYYGIDYHNWYDEILIAYGKMNEVLKDIQGYEIVNHMTVIAERTADPSERKANYELLKAELLDLFRNQLSDKADEYVTECGSNFKLAIDVDALYTQFKAVLSRYEAEIEADVVDGKSALKEAIRTIAVEFANKYPGNGSSSVTKTYAAVLDENGNAYTAYGQYSKYTFTTESTIFENNKVYEATDYTLDTDNVVMVTYREIAGDKEVTFILNYNLFEVDVRIDANTVKTIGSYGYYIVE